MNRQDFNAGLACAAEGRHVDAAAAYLRAVRHDPGFAAGWVNLAGRLQVLGETQAALEAACMAVRTGPALAEAHHVLGTVLHDLGAFRDAVRCYRRALAQGGGARFRAAALTNLGRSLEAEGDFTAAIAACDAAIALDSEMAEPRLGRATALLAAGDFRRGWPAYAARWRLPGASPPRMAMPLWCGEAVRGKTVLLHAEQGLGDTLQFARFATRVAARGARVVLMVQPALVRLLRGLEGVERVLALGEAWPEADLHCPLMDLPAILLRAVADLAPAGPYLRADPALIAARRLPRGGRAPHVGLAWAGERRAAVPHAAVMDRRRSLKLADFAPLAPLCRAEQVVLFSLQLGSPAAQLGAAPEGLRLVDAMQGVADFADTAAIMAQLDLVIAADTSCAHLAAGMGVPTWLLSRKDACWRWMRQRDDSPWYPSMRIFRQHTAGDWTSVIIHLAQSLSKLREPPS